MKLCAVTIKGDRGYVRGADIYAAGLEYLRSLSALNDGRCRVAFRRMTASVPFVSAVKLPKEPVAEMTVGSTTIWFYESDTPAAREPFDEESLIWDNFGLNNAIATSASDARPIDVIVSMTKKLHYRTRSPSKRWMLTRIDFTEVLKAASIWYCVELRTEPNQSLTKSSVIVDDREIGTIFFSDI